MEGSKPTGSSSSSTSELLGSKDSSSSSSSSSSGIFGAIFTPPLNSPKVLSRESLRSELTRKKFTDQPMHFHSGDYSNGKEGEGQNGPNKDMTSYYQDQRVQQPCHLSSSIYYGGQDVYNHPQNSQNTGVINSIFKKDGTDEDGTACRGNWWQGSLYY